MSLILKSIHLPAPVDPDIEEVQRFIARTAR
jgi:hypothetical protein